MKIYELKIFEKTQEDDIPLIRKYFKTLKTLNKFVSGFLKENFEFKKNEFEFLIEKLKVEE